MANGGTSKGGYDYEFVTAPPKALECPVCLLTLRDPHVISCCGNEFCQRCVERVQGDGKPCPLCNEPNFTTLLHKKLVREVNALVIRCPQKEAGCEWEGELGQVQQHLNPGAGQDVSKGCGYVMVACSHQCGAELPRCLLAEHKSKVCPKRPVEMQIASLVEKLESIVTNNQLLKKQLDEVDRSHQNKLEEVEQSHQRELCEMKQTIGQIQKENEQLSQKCDQLQKECVRLGNDVASLKVNKMHLPVPPFYFTFYNFKHWKNVDLRWYSDPFYSHPGGYKMVISMYPNGFGIGKGTYLSIYVCIQRGEFDNQLQWPFNGQITIEVYNHTANTWMNPAIIKLTKNNGIPDYVVCRPTRFRNRDFGYAQYLSHDELWNHYINDKVNYLSMRVVNVELVN